MTDLTLYHNGPSTCSQKVRLILELKKLSYNSIDVKLLAGEQHDPEYVKLNPNHVVPTLVTKDSVLIESNLIVEYLDDAYPEIPARPVTADKHKAATVAFSMMRPPQGFRFTTLLLMLNILFF